MAPHDRQDQGGQRCKGDAKAMQRRWQRVQGPDGRVSTRGLVSHRHRIPEHGQLHADLVGTVRAARTSSRGRTWPSHADGHGPPKFGSHSRQLETQSCATTCGRAASAASPARHSSSSTASPSAGPDHRVLILKLLLHPPLTLTGGREADGRGPNASRKSDAACRAAVASRCGRAPPARLR